jgi:hypothetical protein
MAALPKPEHPLLQTPQGPELVPKTLEERLRGYEPIWEDDDATAVTESRNEMTSKIRRWQRSATIAARREKQAYQAVAQYRCRIRRGHWTDLRTVLAREFYASTRDFLRKVARHSPAANPVGRKRAATNVTTADADSVAGIPNAPTIADRLQAQFAEEAIIALQKVTRSERSDVFARRISKEIECRYQGGSQHPIAERLELAKTILEELGLKAEDLIRSAPSGHAGGP